MPPVVAWAASAIVAAVGLTGTTAGAILAVGLQTAAAVGLTPLAAPHEGNDWTLDQEGDQ